MPRVYDSDSSPINYCRDCFPDEAEAEALHKFPVRPTDNDGRGCCFDWGSDHPPYDGEDYRCHKCRKLLTGKDD